MELINEFKKGIELVDEARVHCSGQESIIYEPTQKEFISTFAKSNFRFRFLIIFNEALLRGTLIYEKETNDWQVKAIRLPLIGEPNIIYQLIYKKALSDEKVKNWHLFYYFLPQESIEELLNLLNSKEVEEAINVLRERWAALIEKFNEAGREMAKKFQEPILLMQERLKEMSEQLVKSFEDIRERLYPILQSPEYKEYQTSYKVSHKIQEEKKPPKPKPEPKIKPKPIKKLIKEINTPIIFLDDSEEDKIEQMLIRYKNKCKFLPNQEIDEFLYKNLVEKIRKMGERQPELLKFISSEDLASLVYEDMKKNWKTPRRKGGWNCYKEKSSWGYEKKERYRYLNQLNMGKDIEEISENYDVGKLTGDFYTLSDAFKIIAYKTDKKPATIERWYYQKGYKGKKLLSNKEINQIIEELNNKKKKIMFAKVYSEKKGISERQARKVRKLELDKGITIDELCKKELTYEDIENWERRKAKLTESVALK